MIFTFKKTKLASAVLFSIIIGATSFEASASAGAASSLRNQMFEQFGTMTNVTSPGSFNTSRRGGFSGGSVVMRNKISNQNLISMQPMSIKGGCGGIDMYLGSFSFISKDSFVQLARNVASNAAGYAFYLAMESLSSAIRGLMTDLQNKMQEMNQYMGNSCQMAQGLVDNTINGKLFQRETYANLVASFKDGTTDFFSNSQNPPVLSSEKISDKSAIQGNVVWKGLKDKGVGGWYKYGGSNLSLAIMSITGTVVVGNSKPSPDGFGNSPEIRKIKGNVISVADLIMGGKVKMLQCLDGTSECLDVQPSSTEYEITGFAQIIREVFLGSNSQGGGILDKSVTGEKLLPSEEKLMESIPAGAGGMIVNLTKINNGLARLFVIQLSETLASIMAFDLVNSFYEDTELALLALEGEQQSLASDALDEIQKSRAKFIEQYNAYVKNISPATELFAKYNNILDTAATEGMIEPVSFSAPGNTK